MITVRNTETGTHTYTDLEALIVSVVNWSAEMNHECQLNVSEDDRLIVLYFDFEDGNITEIIIKDELPECVNADEVVTQLSLAIRLSIE